MTIELRSLRDTSARQIKTVPLPLLLIISLLVACTPRARRVEPTPPTPTRQPTLQPITRLTATSMTFIAEADAQVRESDPDVNYGSSTELMVDGDEDPEVESYIRFNVTGITGPVHAARLRLYVTENASRNSPVVYATAPAWNETTLTWSQRPSRISAALDDHDDIYMESWVEYDVTIFAAENKAYSFVLVADSDDSATFSSREGSHPPELVITLADGPTETVGIPVTGATLALTGIPPQGPVNSLTLTADMDARVKESTPDRNYGTSSTLQVDNQNDPGVESYLRFTITEVAGKVLSARLRVYVTVNGSRNGPAVYATETNWTELGITWNIRPVRTSSAVDNKDRVRRNRWIEYDVTSLVTGNGKYSFVLVADSNDATNFSSREGIRPPELFITFQGGSMPTSTPTPPAYE